MVTVESNDDYDSTSNESQTTDYTLMEGIRTKTGIIDD